MYEFVQLNMPLDEPATLSEQEYWAILAFALHANGVDLGDERLSAENAESFVLHP